MSHRKLPLQGRSEHLGETVELNNSTIVQKANFRFSGRHQGYVVTLTLKPRVITDYEEVTGEPVKTRTLKGFNDDVAGLLMMMADKVQGRVSREQKTENGVPSHTISYQVSDPRQIVADLESGGWVLESDKEKLENAAVNVVLKQQARQPGEIGLA